MAIISIVVVGCRCLPLWRRQCYCQISRRGT